MTVAELITVLQMMPQNLPVTMSVDDVFEYVHAIVIDNHTYTGKFDEVTQKGVYEKTVQII